MQKYDVIITGAGIAGSGLAYNLKRYLPEKRVLVLDKNKDLIRDYRHRLTFPRIIREYSLPYETSYPALNFCTHDEHFFRFTREKFYLVNYRKICNTLLEKSEADFLPEKVTGVSLKHKLIRTSEHDFSYDYLVDCTGINYFLRKKLRLRLPDKLWVGKTRILKGKSAVKEPFYCLNDNGSFEDFYPYGNHIAHGIWRYTDAKDTRIIEPPRNIHFSHIVDKAELAEEHNTYVSANPVFPLYYKNCAFLGDSFGNSTTIASEGIRPILDTSKHLIRAIKRGNLKLYQNSWKKEYFNIYLKHLVSKNLGRRNHMHRMRTIKALREHGDFFYDVLDSKPDLKIPKEVMDKIPLDIKLRQLFYFLKYRASYLFQGH